MLEVKDLEVAYGEILALKGIRFTLGLSQVALAEKLQVAFSTVNRWERGRTKPLPVFMRQLDALETKSIKSKKNARGARR